MPTKTEESTALCTVEAPKSLARGEDVRFALKLKFNKAAVVRSASVGLSLDGEQNVPPAPRERAKEPTRASLVDGYPTVFRRHTGEAVKKGETLALDARLEDATEKASLYLRVQVVTAEERFVTYLPLSIGG